MQIINQPKYFTLIGPADEILRLSPPRVQRPPSPWRRAATCWDTWRRSSTSPHASHRSVKMSVSNVVVFLCIGRQFDCVFTVCSIPRKNEEVVCVWFQCFERSCVRLVNMIFFFGQKSAVVVDDIAAGRQLFVSLAASETQQPNNWSSCLWRPRIYCRRKPTLSHGLTALKELSLTLCHVMERCVELWPPHGQDTHASCPCYLQCVFLQRSYTLWSSC